MLKGFFAAKLDYYSRGDSGLLNKPFLALLNPVGDILTSLVFRNNGWFAQSEMF
jgi:hypothetical protein